MSRPKVHYWSNCQFYSFPNIFNGIFPLMLSTKGKKNRSNHRRVNKVLVFCDSWWDQEMVNLIAKWDLISGESWWWQCEKHNNNPNYDKNRLWCTIETRSRVEDDLKKAKSHHQILMKQSENFFKYSYSIYLYLILDQF